MEVVVTVHYGPPFWTTLLAQVDMEVGVWVTWRYVPEGKLDVTEIAYDRNFAHRGILIGVWGHGGLGVCGRGGIWLRKTLAHPIGVGGHGGLVLGWRGVSVSGIPGYA
jgi:hypothetical protein